MNIKTLTLSQVKKQTVDFFVTHFPRISADTMGWMAAICLHLATIPTLLALLTGLTDNTPNIDVVMFM